MRQHTNKIPMYNEAIPKKKTIEVFRCVGLGLLSFIISNLIYDD